MKARLLSSGVLLAAALLGLGVPGTASAADPQYIVSLGEMTVWDGVSKGQFSKDSDYVGFEVVEPSGKSATQTAQAPDLGKNDRYTWGLPIGPLTVPADAGSQLIIKYTVVNKGSADAEAMKKAIGQGVGKLVPGGPVPQTIAGELARFGLSLIVPNCDAVLFGDILVFDGATLASGGPPGWGAEGPNQWEHVFGFGGPNARHDAGVDHDLNVPPGCDAGAKYGFQIRIERVR